MKTDSIEVAVCGASGKMGQQVTKAVLSQPDMELVGACDIRNVGKDVGEIKLGQEVGVTINDSLKNVLKETSPEVVVEFTAPESAFENIMTILDYSHAVVGTTGLSESNLKQISEKTLKSKYNAIICPNFAIGAVLMIQMAKKAARFFPNAEVIEMHHQKKLDAPSGTSIATANAIADARSEYTSTASKSKEVEKGALGANIKGVHVHSVRLPGLVAHQSVIFGGEGQTLTIRHDSSSRSSFMPGVMLAIREVKHRRGMTMGLENLISF